MRQILLKSGMCALLMLCMCVPAQAVSTRTYDKVGTGVAIALPIIASGISLAHDDDWTGIAELGVSSAAALGTVMLLKQVVHERRPDGSDYKSFPSSTAVVAYSSADYLWRRYGWKYGVPAYAVAALVGFTRVQAKQHHWYDVLASSAIAFGFNYAIVTHYQNRRLYSVYAASDGDSIGLNFAMTW